MKKWKYTLFLPLLLLMMAGCSREQESNADGRVDNTVVIEARITTRNTADGLSLSSAERVIRRLRVYAFDGKQLDKMVYHEYTSSAEEVVVKMDVSKTPNKMLYVIINEPNDPVVQNQLSLINDPVAFDALEYEMAHYFSNMAGSVLNIDAPIFTDSKFCLPMFGKTEKSIDTSVKGGGTLEVPMSVRRSLARVDIYLQKATGVKELFQFDSNSSIDIANTRAKGNYSSQKTPSGSLEAINGVAGPTTGRIIPVRNVGDNSAALRAYTFYTPARSCAEESERLSFTLKGIGASEKRIDYASVIIGNKTGEELKEIEQNKVYRVYCTLKDSGIELATTIADWDDMGVTGDIIVGSILVTGRSQVMMNYATQGDSFSTKVDYYADGPVWFVGYISKDVHGKEVINKEGSDLPTWLPKANITGLPDGTTVNGTISLTYVPTPDAHPDVVMRIKTGNVTKDITVIYDNGFIPNSLLAENGWTANLPATGLQLAKIGNARPSEAALVEEINMQWSPLTDEESIEAAKNEDYGGGEPNTDAIMGSLSGPGSAAAVCRAMGLKWYLPSLNELILICKIIKNCSSSYSVAESNIYWSSTEFSYTNSYGVYTDTGATINARKDGKNFKVRCVRNL